MHWQSRLGRQFGAIQYTVVQSLRLSLSCCDVVHTSVDLGDGDLGLNMIVDCECVFQCTSRLAHFVAKLDSDYSGTVVSL